MASHLNRISAELSEFIAASGSTVATLPMSLENEMVFIPPDQRREWEVVHVTDQRVFWRAVRRGRINETTRDSGDQGRPDSDRPGE